MVKSRHQRPNYHHGKRDKLVEPTLIEVGSPVSGHTDIPVSDVDVCRKRGVKEGIGSVCHDSAIAEVNGSSRTIAEKREIGLSEDVK